jgi:hypothetical protein
MSENRRDQLAGSGATTRCDAPWVDGAGEGLGGHLGSATGAGGVDEPAVRLLGRRPGQVIEYRPSGRSQRGGRIKDPRSPETKAAFARALAQPWFPCMADLISCGLCTERVTPCLLRHKPGWGGMERHGPAEEPWLM